MAFALLRSELECSICLALYTDPVTLACGHNFCWSCIDKALSTQEASGSYNCPECRQEFPARPGLQRNRTLANIVEHLAKRLKKEEVTCTYCIQGPEPAIRSCLMCEASLCQKHLQVHSRSAEHILCQPTTTFDKLKCSTHSQMFLYFCSTCDAYLCLTCTTSRDHGSHALELLRDVSNKKIEELMIVLEELQKQKKDIETEMEDVDLPKKQIEEQFSVADKKMCLVFKEINKQVRNLEKGIRGEIKEQCKKVVNVYTELSEELDQRKQDVSRKIDHITELCQMTDPIAVLQEPDLDTSSFSNPQWNSKVEIPDMSQNVPDESRYLMVIQKGLAGILNDVKRRFPIEEEANIILDINTAANNVLISDGGKRASWKVHQGRPKVPKRFQYHQALSTEAFSSGRHYWDVEGSEAGNWMVGVAYPSIEREGSQAIIGKNEKSWSFCRWNSHHYVLHSKKQTQLRITPGCRRFRVCLDCEAGVVAFHELDNPTKPIHTFTTTKGTAFAEPLHAAVSVWDGACVTFLTRGQ